MPDCIVIQLYLQNQVGWICLEGQGLLNPRLDQRENESKKTWLSRSSLIWGKNQTGAREVWLLAEAEGIFLDFKVRSSVLSGLESGIVLPTPGRCFLQGEAELPIVRPQSTSLTQTTSVPVSATWRCEPNQWQYCQGPSAKERSLDNEA